MRYAIVSKAYPRFRVDIGACTPEHARSVYDQLLVEPTVPSDLKLLTLDAPAKWWQPWRKRTSPMEEPGG